MADGTLAGALGFTYNVSDTEDENAPSPCVRPASEREPERQPEREPERQPEREPEEEPDGEPEEEHEEEPEEEHEGGDEKGAIVIQGGEVVQAVKRFVTTCRAVSERNDSAFPFITDRAFTAPTPRMMHDALRGFSQQVVQKPSDDASSYLDERDFVAVRPSDVGLEGDYFVTPMTSVSDRVTRPVVLAYYAQETILRPTTLAHANGLGEGACVTDLCNDGVGCLSIIPKDIVTQRGKCTVVFFIKSAAKSVMMPVCIFDVITPATGATATEMVLNREFFQSRVLDRLSALLKTAPGPALLLEDFFAERYSNREMLPAYKGFTARVVAGTGLVLLGSWHDVLSMLGGGAAADETEEIMSFFAPSVQVRGEPDPLRAVQVSYVTVETAGAGDEDEMRLFQRVRRVARTLAPAHVVVDGQAAGDHKYEFVFHGDTFSEMRIIREAWRVASRGRDVPFSLNYGTRICKSPAWDARGLMPGTNGSTRPGRMGRLSAAGSTLARVALSAMQLGDCRRLPLSGCLASIGIARATPHDIRKKSTPVRSLEEYRLAPIMSMDEAATHLQAEGVLTSDFFAGAGGELYAKKLDEQKRRIDALKKRFAQGMASSAAVAPLQMRIQSQSEKIKTQDEELVKSRRANKRLRDEQARMQEEKQKAEARARAIENDFMQELQGLSQQVEADEAIRREAERVVRTADAGERPDKRAKANVS